MHLSRLFCAVAVIGSATFLVACGGGGGGTDAPVSGPAAAVSAVSGSSATVAAGIAAPISLVAKVTDAGGRAVAGASVAWGTGSGSVTPGSSTTDGSGQTTAQWTPGNVAGAQTATASVAGAGSATFSATVTAGVLAKIKLAPDTTKLAGAGSTGQLTVTFSDAFGNAVSGATPTLTTDDPLVATVSGTGLVTGVRNGITNVRATSGSVIGSAFVLVGPAPNPCVGVTMTLAVGASQTLTGSAASQFCVNGAIGAEFVAVPFYATGFGGTGTGQKNFVAAPILSATFTPLTNTTASGPPTPSVGANSNLRGSVAAGVERGLTRDVAWETHFRERARTELAPFLGSRGKLQRQSTGARHSVSISAAVVGDAITLNTNANVGCTDPIPHTAKIVAVSSHAIIVNDDQSPAGFTQPDYDAIASTFDSQVWPVDTDNFGVPTDLDKNGKVILFFTPTVNALTPRTSTSFVGGFFYGRDLIPNTGSNACAGSNFAEMFYLLTPDPAGTFSSAKTADFVKSITMGTVAHEFQHLINLSRHISDLNPTVFKGFGEETFLDEGLAHIAEELNYYAATGRSPRTNINATTLTVPDDAYQAFGRQNTVRFREYLKNPDRYPPYSVLVDSSLAVRGGIWSLLRYSADRRNSTVPEKTTWFDLVNPKSDVTGMNNLRTVFGSDFLLQMRDWAVANYLDDANTGNTNPAFTLPSWNTRSTESFVNSGAFPLKTTPLVSSPVMLDLADGGAGYFRFAVGAGAVGGATVTSGSGLPTTFSITVVRTK